MKLSDFAPATSIDASLSVESLCAICNGCAIKEFCLPPGFIPSEFADFDRIIKCRQTLNKKEAIYQSNDKFDGIFAIQSGAVKCFRTSYDGAEEILGFYLPGDLIGLEGLHNNRYENSAVCLEKTVLCKIDLDDLLVISGNKPYLQRQLLNIMSERIAIQGAHYQQRTAEHRVAAFLLTFSLRYCIRGKCQHEFHLPMSRQEIGNYLNLAPETISRIITHFHQQKIIIADHKHIKLLKPKVLQDLAL